MNPTNQASRNADVVPVFPAAGRPMSALGFSVPSLITEVSIEVVT